MEQKHSSLPTATGLWKHPPPQTHQKLRAATSKRKLGFSPRKKTSKFEQEKRK